MRMKIKSPDDRAFARAESIVEPSGKLILKNRKRLTLSVEDPTAAMMDAIRSAGSQIVPDR